MKVTLFILGNLELAFSQLAGEFKNWYTDSGSWCERCINNGHNWCNDNEYILDSGDSGICCADLEYSGQYCDADYPYCTQSLISAASDADSDPT
jgi:hypothetical protein